MGRMIATSLQLPTAVSNGISTAHTYTGAGAMGINGSLASGGVADLVTAQRVGFISANAGDTTQTVAIVGTDREGNVIGETVALNGTTAVYSKQDFLTVTSETISAATAGNITSGTVGVGSTPWQLADIMITPFSLALWCTLLSGAATFSIEYSPDDPNAPATAAGTAKGYEVYPTADTISFGSQVPPSAWTDGTIAAKTANASTSISFPVFAWRLTITSGTGKVLAQAIQAGVRN